MSIIVSKSQNLRTPNADQDVDQWKLSVIAGGSAEWYSYTEKYLESYNLNINLNVRACCMLNHIWLFVTPWSYSMPGFAVLHCVPEFAQIHIHWVSDATQPSHPLFPTPPPALNLSQHQGLSQWVDSVSGGQSTGASASGSVLPMNIQDWFPLGLTGLISLQSKGLSRVFSNTTVQKYQFFGTQLSLWSNSHIHTWLLEKP